MTAEEFTKLPTNRKVQMVLDDGRELLDRIYMYFVVKLYSIEGLYIEIWYQQISNRIDRVIVVNPEDVLHLYESQINISDIFDSPSSHPPGD